jgi:hypothetical protein
VAVEARVDGAEDPDDEEREEHEIDRHDRVGDEGVERPVGEVVGVIERIAPLLEGGEGREEDERGGMEQEDRLVRVGGPGEPHRGGEGDAAELLPAGQAIGVGGLQIALGHGAERAVEDLGRIGGGVEPQHDQRPQPGAGEPAGLGLDRDTEEGEFDAQARQQDEGLVGHEELDEERRAPEDEDEPFGGLAQGEVGEALATASATAKKKPRPSASTAK